MLHEAGCKGRQKRTVKAIIGCLTRTTRSCSRKGTTGGAQYTQSSKGIQNQRAKVHGHCTCALLWYHQYKKTNKSTNNYKQTTTRKQQTKIPYFSTACKRHARLWMHVCICTAGYTLNIESLQSLKYMMK